MKTMHKDFRGECIYQAEVDVHFPQLTVGQTLAFAAKARAPRNRIPGVTRKQYAEHMRDVVMAVFGLSHTLNTKVKLALVTRNPRLTYQTLGWKRFRPWCQWRGAKASQHCRGRIGWKPSPVLG